MHELLKESNNGVALYDVFSHYIKTLMGNDLWKSGSVTNKRFFWEDGKLASWQVGKLASWQVGKRARQGKF